MKIDMFTHILTRKYGEAISQYASKFIRAVPALGDLEQRFRIMDDFGEHKQVLTFTLPFIEAIAGPKEAAELARLGNDEIAELVTKYPDRFIAGVANLPMNDADAACEEAERALTDLGLKGIQISTNIQI